MTIPRMVLAHSVTPVILLAFEIGEYRRCRKGAPEDWGRKSSGTRSGDTGGSMMPRVGVVSTVAALTAKILLRLAVKRPLAAREQK
jgi:hypothetical protein